MAKEPEDLDLDVEGEAEAPKAKGSKLKLIIIILVVLLLVGGGTGAALYFFGVIGQQAEVVEGEEVAEVAKPEAHYFDMDPPLTVNFQGSPRLRYLQVGIQLMAYDAKAFDPVRQHMPVVRNNLIMLLSAKTYDELISREGKEALREEALQEIRKILEERAGDSGIEAVYFTSFVMQ